MTYAQIKSHAKYVRKTISYKMVNVSLTAKKDTLKLMENALNAILNAKHANHTIQINAIPVTISSMKIIVLINVQMEHTRLQSIMSLLANHAAAIVRPARTDLITAHLVMEN